MKIIDVKKNNGTAGGYMIFIGDDAAIFQREEPTRATERPLTYNDRIIIAFCEDWISRPKRRSRGDSQR